MSVRKVYRVLVNGNCYFSGSYKIAMDVYLAFFRYFSQAYADGERPVCDIAFTPAIDESSDDFLCL